MLLFIPGNMQHVRPCCCCDGRSPTETFKGHWVQFLMNTHQYRINTNFLSAVSYSHHVLHMDTERQTLWSFFLLAFCFYFSFFKIFYFLGENSSSFPPPCLASFFPFFHLCLLPSFYPSLVPSYIPLSFASFLPSLLCQYNTFHSSDVSFFLSFFLHVCVFIFVCLNFCLSFSHCLLSFDLFFFHSFLQTYKTVYIDISILPIFLPVQSGWCTMAGLTHSHTEGSIVQVYTETSQCPLKWG